MRSLPQVKEEIEELKEARTLIEGNWKRAENQFLGILPQRVGARGQALPTVNVNETFKSVFSFMRAVVEGILFQPQIFKIIPDNIEDVDFAEIFQHYLSHKIRRIPDFNFSFLNFAINSNLYGFGVGKLMVEPLEFEPISPWDIWIDQAISPGRIKQIMHRIYLTKEELLERRDNPNYGYDHLAEYLVEAKKEEIATTTTKKSIRKKYEIWEYWYEDDDEWRVMTIGVVGNEPTIMLRDIATPYWFGHPFIFGINIPRFDSLYGLGEADLLYESQRGETMLLNLYLDQLQVIARPPVFFDPDIIADVADLEPLLNPEQGGYIPIPGLSIHPTAIREFARAPLSPTFFSAIEYLERLSEELRGTTGLLATGEAPPSREPMRTTMARLNISRGALMFRLWLLGESLKELGKRIVLSIFENPPTDEMTEILTNKGRATVIVKRGKRTDVLKEVRTGIEGNIPFYTLILPRSREKALKFQNIQVMPAFLEEKDAAKKADLVEKVRATAELMRISPEVAKLIDIPELLREFYRGDIRTEKLFKE